MKRGFTLIELLLSITLIAIVSTFVFTSFVEYGNQQVFKSAVVEVVSVIKVARQKTLSAETTTQFGVYVATSSLVVFEGSSYSVSNPTNKVFPVPGMSLDAQLSDGTKTLIFTRLTGAPSATGTINIGYSRLNSTTTITIQSAGLIE